MVHPTNLFRSDSEGAQSFSAPVGNYFNDIDCGITALPCLTHRLRLEKLAKLSVFLIVLSLLGLVHGIISTYFKATSQLWFSHYNFPSFVEVWFVFLNEIFVGLLALCISYWGNRLHRATCLGVLTMLIAVSGGTLAIPEIYNPFTKLEITSAITGPALCTFETLEHYTKDVFGTEGFNETTFGYFFIFQIMFSMATISYISHGLSYVDDHISAKHSPALLGLVLAAQEAGKQFGIYFSWVPYILKMFSIFTSPVWILLVSITFLVGVTMAMFPKVLPHLAIKKSVNSLVSIASGGVAFDQDDIQHSFCKVIKSLLQNKVLLLNIMSFVLMQSALLNFRHFEKYFNQSKYHVPIEERDSTGYSDPDIIQFTTNLLRQPLVAISLVTCGMIISKLRPKPKYLVLWNITAFVLVVFTFSSTAFWNCTKGIYNEHKHAITIPFCSSKCNCPYGESFQPVCADGKTYFSPCLAGCRNYSASTSAYHNCSCGSVVTRGSCDQDNCTFVLAIGQVNNILTNALIASSIVINFLITFRSVPSKYKAAALGLELTFLGIIPFIPVKIIYHTATNLFCEIPTLRGCQFFSDFFPTILLIITISFMLGAIILEGILFYCVKDLELYPSEFSKYNTHEFRPNRSDTDDNRTIEEDSPFIRRLGTIIKTRLQRPTSREERIKRYIEQGELVPQLQPTRKSPRSSDISIESNNPVGRIELNGETVIVHEGRPHSRNSHLRNSKASGESDMSSLYRFADSILNVSDSDESEPSVKISQTKIVFQLSPQNNPVKVKKPKKRLKIPIAPDSTQPQRPAPVPNFLVETNL